MHVVQAIAGPLFSYSEWAWCKYRTTTNEALINFHRLNAFPQQHMFDYTTRILQYIAHEWWGVVFVESAKEKDHSRKECCYKLEDKKKTARICHSNVRDENVKLSSPTIEHSSEPTLVLLWLLTPRVLVTTRAVSIPTAWMKGVAWKLESWRHVRLWLGESARYFWWLGH